MRARPATKQTGNVSNL